MDMALSLDTAEISEIEEAASWGVLGGVTTNPTLISRAGLAATNRLHAEGINVNMTLVFSPNQAILAAKAGAWCCSPFAGRLDDISWDGLGLVAEICEIFRVQEFTTKVLAASLRQPDHVMDAARAGADIATMPFKVFKMLVQHPL